MILICEFCFTVTSGKQMGAQNISHPGVSPGSESRGNIPAIFAGIPQVKQTASFHPDRLSVLKGKSFPPHSHHSLSVPSVADG